MKEKITELIRELNRLQGYTTGHAEILENPLLDCPTKTLCVQRVLDEAILPEISKGNAGIDLRVLTEDGEKVVIGPGGFHKFRTGIKVEPPEGYYIDIVPRSSMGCKKTLRLMNTIGIIDQTYRGELLIFVHNFGKVNVEVENNERLCQMVIRRDEAVDFRVLEVPEVSPTERGELGFGSSGRI